MAKYALGIKAVRFGTPEKDVDGNFVMPAALEQFAETVQGSMTLEETDPTVQDFNTEESDAPELQSITESSKLEGTWQTRDLSSAGVKKVKGGTVVEDNGVDTPESYEAPAKTTFIELAVEIETDTGMKVNVPRANLRGRFVGNLGKEEAWKLEVKFTALSPGSGEGAFKTSWPQQTT
jgi:hypothetical protein